MGVITCRFENIDECVGSTEAFRGENTHKSFWNISENQKKILVTLLV